MQVSVDEAQARLPEPLRQLGPNQELIMLENGQLIARIVPTAQQQSGIELVGGMRATVLWMGPEFDEPVEAFQEHMK